jgi:hypothetical protein
MLLLVQEGQLAEHLAIGHLVNPMPIHRQLDPPVDDDPETLVRVALAHQRVFESILAPP